MQKIFLTIAFYFFNFPDKDLTYSLCEFLLALLECLIESEALNLKKKYVLIGIIILVVLCAGIGIGFVLNRSNTVSDGNEGVTIDKNAQEYEDKESGTDNAASIRFPGYPEITVSADQNDIPIVLTNPDVNPCYFQFTVSLDDGNPIYESEWVKPGDAIKGFEMDAPLQPGDYEMNISIATKSLGAEKTMNGGNVKTTLHVAE